MNTDFFGGHKAKARSDRANCGVRPSKPPVSVAATITMSPSDINNAIAAWIAANYGISTPVNAAIQCGPHTASNATAVVSLNEQQTKEWLNRSLAR